MSDFKKVLLWICVIVLIREVFIYTGVGQILDGEGKEFVNFATEKLKGIFNFSTHVSKIDVPRIEKPEVPPIDIVPVERVDVSQIDISHDQNPQIPRVDIPKIEKTRVPKVNIPKQERIRVPKVNIPKIR